MKAFSCSELLDVWERALPHGTQRRALELLSAGNPDEAHEELARWPIGRRDQQLLALREATFGPRIEAIAQCRTCGERLELSFDAADICAPALPTAVPAELELRVGEYVVRVRPPNTADMLSAAAAAMSAGPAGVLAARATLLTSCVMDAHRGQTNDPVEPTALPKEVVDAISRRLSEADPQADVQLELECPACHANWSEPFDIAAFFWTELHAWATRMLREVHALARFYGWNEFDILAMSPVRRRFYLELTGA